LIPLVLQYASSDCVSACQLGSSVLLDPVLPASKASNSPIHTGTPQALALPRNPFTYGCAVDQSEV
jgi:hypothetical protein